MRTKNFYINLFPDVLYGLLLPAVLGGQKASLLVAFQRHVGSQHLHAGQNMEAGHVLLQWQTVVPPHHNHTQQVRQTLPRRQSFVLL